MSDHVVNSYLTHDFPSFTLINICDIHDLCDCSDFNKERLFTPGKFFWDQKGIATTLQTFLPPPNGLSGNFQDTSGIIHGTIWKIRGMSRLSPWGLGFFCCVFKEILVCCQNYGTTDERICVTFYVKVRPETRNHLIIFGMLLLTL